MMVALLGAMVLVEPVRAELPARERVSFNSDWKFRKGDPAGIELSYDSLKIALLGKGPAPEAGAFAQPDFDDSTWRKVRVPHDWGIEGPFRQEYPGETGKLPWWGVGWYRKEFTSMPADAKRQVYLDFDGAMSYATVWLNGHFVGGRPYGYSSFRVDLTPHLKPGAKNIVAVRLDNPPESSRWYPGGGIYRNVWLVKTNPTAIAQYGVTVTTPRITDASADIDVKVALSSPTTGTVSTAIYSQVGSRKRFVAKLADASVQNASSVSLQGMLPHPRRWTLEKPSLYVAVTTVRQDGRTIDSVETPFGIRTIEFDAKIGFRLNGVKTYMKGVCMHHDLGAIGAAFNVRAAERQLEILKSMGVNALRTSHNPPAPELLDLCDRMGFLVMDEFADTWTRPKKQNGYAKLFADWHEIDLRTLIQRDRNHPSVVMWSSGNEIPEQDDAKGHAISQMLTDIIHSEDRTRPVASGNDRVQAAFNGWQKTVDVFGYNYKPWNYGRFRTANPDLALFGSETASAISSRGEYFFPVEENQDKGKADFQVSSYDLYAPGWATTPDYEFKGQDENPSVFGEFVWTGFDYLGEPTPYNWDSTILLNYSDPVERAEAEAQLKQDGRIHVPSRSSYFGIVDLAGFPKDRYYIYQARWRPEVRMAHLLPHWNWPDRVGLVTPVHLYSSGDEAELFLNGKSLGKRKRGSFEYRFRWDNVVYAPGRLEAVVTKGGKFWAKDVVTTTGEASRLELKSDRKSIRSDGDDLAYITVKVADKSGQTVPRSKPRIQFHLEGPGEIVATDNGDATDLETFSNPSRRAYNGIALVIVRAKKPGHIIVTAESPGLTLGTAFLEAK